MSKIQDKRNAAKRPRRRYVFFYKHLNEWSRFELDNEEQANNWTSFCKLLKGIPTKLNYETFIKTK